MNRSTFSAIALTVAALAASNAIAADASAPKTREQVKAELAQAVRTGDIVANGETGQKAHEMFPGLYPAKPAVQGKTREQVQAELAQAIRTGDVMVNGETGLTARELAPAQYPAQSSAPTKTREQVKAELVQAVRNGDLVQFAAVMETYKESFRADENLSLVERLGHNVLKTGLRKISISYSRISLQDLAAKLHLPSASAAEYICAKAIR